MKRIVLAMACLLIVTAYGCERSSELMLFDFEADAELDGVHWKCHTLMGLSDEHVTHGKKSLKLELYPSAYPGLNPVLEEHYWKDYETLCFDVYNTEKREIRLTIRIDDQEDMPDYEDRYNKGFPLRPGMNEIRIPLKTLITSGTGRYIDLGNIRRFLIFIVKPAERVVLYVDYGRLEKGRGR